MDLPFSISGKVIHGKSLGNTYDAPTANIMPIEDISALPNGVYYSEVSADGTTYPAITNLGVRPTVSDDGRVCAETYIYDYDGDLYDKIISVTLLEFRRPETRFASLDELYGAVEEDFRAGRAYHHLP